VKILVTGASGLLGRTLVPLASERHEVLALSRDGLDVSDPASVARAFREFSPEAVLHCAAFTDVDGAERAPALALEVNAEGAARVAREAMRSGAAFLYVSSDYVFDGRARSPYLEEESTNPISSYGRSKLEGERLVAQACPGLHLIVRTGWLYGPGKGFVDWCRARLEAGEDLPLVSDQRGSPTSVRELASAMLTLVEQGRRGIFHFVNPGEASWLDLGRAIAEELGLDARGIRSIRGSDLNRPAARPPYSALSVSRYEKTTGERARPWREALHLYLQGAS
jgi:dTDP-4-dehydrorhamnose reductase